MYMVRGKANVVIFDRLFVASQHFPIFLKILITLNKTSERIAGPTFRIW